MSKNKILLIGTLPPPYQGQPIAFASAFFILEKHYTCKVLSTSFKSEFIILSIYKFFKYFFLLPFHIILFRPEKIYFLCSRTFIGGLRDVYLLMLVYFTNIKIYNHLHGSDFNIYVNNLPSIYKKIVIFLYNRVNNHAVLTKGMEEQFHDVFNKNPISIIPNFYEVLSYGQPKFVSENDNIIKLIYLSSIVKTKGVLELVQAFKILRSKGRNVSLTICGDYLSDEKMSKTEIESEFIKLISNDENIEYLGSVDKEKKYKLLYDSNIFVLPTYYRSEAVPLSIIEAMACGCAVVTTDYRYLPSIVLPKINGELVKPRSVDDLVAKIDLIINDRFYLNNLSKNNLLEAAESYNEDIYHQNILNFIES